MQMYVKYEFGANKMRKIYRKAMLFNLCLHLIEVLRLFRLQKVVVLCYMVSIVLFPCLINYIKSN